jgi:hypothetical protein
VAYTWAPTLAQVATYVPWLTVSKSAPGSQAYLYTFSADTIPDNGAAQLHINDAATIVGSLIGTLPVAIEPLAAVATALLAASTLATAYPRDLDDDDAATLLAARYAAALKALLTAADEAGASTTSAQPVLIAPLPVEWGDQLLVDDYYPGGVRWVIQ